MSKHTPGPWRVNVASIESGKYKYPEIVHETKPGSIVHDVIATSLAWQWRAREEEHWANANLLAAAPDLLEALQEGLDTSEFAAAMNFDGSPNTIEFCENLYKRLDNFQKIARAAIAKAEGDTDPAAAVHKMRDAEYRRKAD